MCQHHSTAKVDDVSAAVISEQIVKVKEACGIVQEIINKGLLNILSCVCNCRY